MRLPIPYQVGEKIISELEVEAPRAGTLAETQRMAEEGKPYSAISILVAGCITDEKSQAMVQAMPYRNAELLALHAVLKISPDDGFEGAYKCPRCGTQIICELSVDEDTRDFVKDVPVGYREDVGIVTVTLDEPVIFKRDGEEIDRVEEMTLRYPTLEDCKKAESRVGTRDTMKLQFALYAQSIETVNGNAVNATWKASFGPVVFEKMSAKSLLQLGREMSKYGMQSSIEKICSRCGKQWKAAIDTSSFFESALRTE